MRTNIFLKEIMQTNFPIIDILVPLDKCLKKMNGKETAIVIENGSIKGVIDYDDLLRGVLQQDSLKEAVAKEILQKKSIKVLPAESDAYEALEHMNKGVEFILVKENNSIIGLVTKQEIAEIEPLILETLTTGK